MKDSDVSNVMLVYGHPEKTTVAKKEATSRLSTRGLFSEKTDGEEHFDG